MLSLFDHRVLLSFINSIFNVDFQTYLSKVLVWHFFINTVKHKKLFNQIIKKLFSFL